MPKFLIERELPSGSSFSPTDLQEIAERSNRALRELGPAIQWVQSYVTGDKITCVYISTDAELVREHARRGRFPADRVMEIMAIIDPTTEESKVGV